MAKIKQEGIDKMINWDELTAKFVEVRDTLNQTKYKTAYRMAFKQPWKFYRNNTPKEAIEILINKYGE